MATHALLIRVSTGAAALGAWLAPSAALACPYCAASSAGGIGLRVALGFFLLLPFAVVGVVYSVLRREAE
jgi:hypothetical protein